MCNLCPNKAVRKTDGATPRPGLLSPVHVSKDVAPVIAHGQLEGQRCVVALQHGQVVVQQGQLAARVAQEGVGPPRVVHIMDGGCNERSGLVDGV